MYCQDYYSYLILVQFRSGKDLQPNSCQYPLINYFELEEQEDEVDGQVIATRNNCQSESSPLDSPQPGCLDTSTLRLLEN